MFGQNKGEFVYRVPKEVAMFVCLSLFLFCLQQQQRQHFFKEKGRGVASHS